MYNYLIQDKDYRPLFYATTPQTAINVLTFNLSAVGCYRYNNGRLIKLSDNSVLMEWQAKKII